MFNAFCHHQTMNMQRFGSLCASPLAIEEREHLRLPLYLPAFMLSPGDIRDPVIVTDISASGCKVAACVRVTMGRYLGIQIPGFARYSGWVAWQTREGFGLDFTNPLPEAVVAHIVRLGLMDGPHLAPALGFTGVNTLAEAG